MELPEIKTVAVGIQASAGDEAQAERIMALAKRIMAVTEESGVDRVECSVALWRAVAGYYARLTDDAGNEAQLAGEALLLNAQVAARLAIELVNRHRRRR